MSSQQDGPNPEQQWLEAGQELGQIMQKQIMSAIAPVLTSVGSDVAEAMRDQLRRGGGPQEPPSQTPQSSSPRADSQQPDSQQPDSQQPGQPRQHPPATVPESPSQPGDGEASPSPTNRAPRDTGDRRVARYVRLMTSIAAPGRVLNARDTVNLWQDRLADIFRNADGFVGAYVLGNPGGTTGLTITLWESEQAAMMSDTLARIVPEIEPFILGEPNVEGYQVIFSL